MPASMRSLTLTKPASRGRPSQPSLRTSARLSRVAVPRSSRGPTLARRRALWRLCDLISAFLQTEAPQAFDQLEHLRLARFDLRRLPLQHPSQSFIEGRERYPGCLEIDLELARQVLIAGAVVLRFGHQHQISQRFCIHLALAGVRKPTAPL